MSWDNPSDEEIQEAIEYKEKAKADFLKQVENTFFGGKKIFNEGSKKRPSVEDHKKGLMAPAFRGEEFREEAMRLVDDIGSIRKMDDAELNHYKVKAKSEIRRLRGANKNPLAGKDPLVDGILSLFGNVTEHSLTPVRELLELIIIEEERREKEANKPVDNNLNNAERRAKLMNEKRKLEFQRSGEFDYRFDGRSYEELNDAERVEYEKIDKEYDAQIQALRERIDKLY